MSESLLSGLKILDFSTLLPGPFATMMLSDMGAEVIHVVSPTRPDLVRLMPPYLNGQSAAHGYLNRNKKPLALDLKNPDSVKQVHELIQEYDIIVEQFRPGVMARLGLDYETLAKINPRVIYCSITGYGQTGSYRNRAGHDINYLALSGVSGNSGRKVSGPPPLGIQVADVAGGSLHSVIGILAAVIERQRSNQGQHIDISMTDCAFTLNAMAGAAQIGGVAQTPESSFLNGGSFYDYYETSDGGWISVGSVEPQFMSGLAQVLELPVVAEKGASLNPEDVEIARAALRDKFKTQPLSHWEGIFGALDVCVEPVRPLDKAMQSEIAKERNWLVEVPVEENGSEKQTQIGHPIKFSRSKPVYRFIGQPMPTA